MSRPRGPETGRSGSEPHRAPKLALGSTEPGTVYSSLSANKVRPKHFLEERRTLCASMKSVLLSLRAPIPREACEQPVAARGSPVPERSSTLHPWRSRSGDSSPFGCSPECRGDPFHCLWEV